MLNKLNQVYGKQVVQFIFMIFLLTFIGVMLLFFRFVSKSSLRFFYLLWNLMLAYVPLVFSLLIKYHISEHKLIRKERVIPYFIIGFLFYPNAPYMITDLIHLKTLNFYGSEASSIPFNPDIGVWYDFIVNCLFIFVGLFIAFISLYMLQDIIKRKMGFKLSWFFIVMVHIITSCAIYVGRFLRWNSWDIVRQPIVVIIDILKHLDFSFLMFISLFSVFLFLFYLTFYLLINKETEETMPYSINKPYGN